MSRFSFSSVPSIVTDTVKDSDTVKDVVQFHYGEICLIWRGAVWCDPLNPTAVVEAYLGRPRLSRWLNQFDGFIQNPRSIVLAVFNSLCSGRGLVDGMYWAVGPHFQSNVEGLEYDQLVPFGPQIVLDANLDAAQLQALLHRENWFGLLWIDLVGCRLFKLERSVL